MNEIGDSAQRDAWGRWATPDDIVSRYGITRAHLRKLIERGAWPCHKYGKMTRFSPADQEAIDSRWLKYAGDDPPKRALGWRGIAMKENLTDEERDAVQRGYEASVYLGSLGLSG